MLTAPATLEPIVLVIIRPSRLPYMQEWAVI